MTKGTIQITELSDSSDCETCGYSYADGFAVGFPDGSELTLEPSAHCYAGASYTDRDLMIEILTRLGYDVVFDEGVVE